MSEIGSKAFETKEYGECLKNLVNHNEFKNCITEEDIRKKFENETNRILRIIHAIPNKEYIQFSSEVGTDNGRRIDSKYKNILIEYKKYGRLDSLKDHKDAIDQIKDYMNDSKFIGKSIHGILFDGKTMEIFHKNEHQEFLPLNRKLDGYLSILNLDFYFKTAFLSGKKELSAYCIKNDFEINNPEINRTYRKIFGLLKNRKNKRTTLMLEEWKKMFKLSENDSTNGKATHPDIIKRRSILSALTGSVITDSNNEYLAIFALHTLFSIILKLLLLKTVNEFKEILNSNKLENTSDFDIIQMKIFLEQLENGDLLKKAGLVNMVEGDFFSWYVKETENWDDEFVNDIKYIISCITCYEDARLKNYSTLQDIFRELYESFIPGIIRHCFGEYYTPYWLADNLLIKSSKGKSDFYSVLDPCCGSGTFLINALNKRIDAIQGDHNYIKKIDFNELLKGIVGIDLNPLAVLMARINIYINAAPYITEYSIIEVPIYNGDSTYSPTIEIIDGIKMLSYSLQTTIMGDKTFDISLPFEYVKSENFIMEIDNLESYILEKNEEQAIEYLMNSINKIIYIKSDNVKKIIVDEICKLIDLEKKELNGIWLRIISNYLKTGVLGKFDCVIGNPPWVRWNVLPENYRNIVKTKCKLEGLFSSDTNSGGVDLNICALIANKCCEKWLSPKGRLSFLMPRSLLFNKSFEGFRNFTIDTQMGKEKCYFESVDSWTKAGSPFGNVKELFCTYNITLEKQNYTKGIPYKEIIKIDKTKVKNNYSWELVKSHFKTEEKLLAVFSSPNNNNFTLVDNIDDLHKINKIIGENEYNFRKGADAQYPMRLKFYKNISETTAEFYTYEMKGKRIKQTENTIILETKYIKPFINAPMIYKNEIRWNHEYVIAAYNGNKKPVCLQKIEEETPKTARYLLQWQSVLNNRSSFNARIQNNKEFYALLRIGNYSFMDNFVVMRDNTKVVSSVVTKIITDWGVLETPIFDGHVSYISEREKGGKICIKNNEAKYINSILNLKICRDYIISSSSLRSIGTRFNVKIPLYKNEEKFNEYLEAISNCDDEDSLERAYLKLLG